MFELKKTEGKARRGEFTCAHGTVQTPVFMNVGTQGAIKGALSAKDLKDIGCQVELSNTYHLHLRPTDTVVRQMGGLHKFMTWDGPILTDSGGFQVFSLSSLRKIKEEGVYFASHIDGHKIFMGPEESMQIQSNLGSDMCMAFDECIENPSPRDYVQKSVDRTYRWLVRCKAENARLNALPDTVNPRQMLWGINQGGTYADIRVDHMKRIHRAELSREFCCHGIDHLLDVARIAYIRVLERKMPFRKETVYAAALLHDLGKAEQYEHGEPHEVAGARVATNILMDIDGFSALEKTAIVAAVAQHRCFADDASPLGKLLYEADKVSRPCYACVVRERCDWLPEKMNVGIKI